MRNTDFNSKYARDAHYYEYIINGGGLIKKI